MGQWDCGVYTAAWIERVRGFDAYAEWRGSYSSPLRLWLLLKKRGGIVAHFDACLAPLGIGRTEDPKRGDICILAGEAGETAGIVLGSTVALIPRDGPGLIVRHRSAATVLAAWDVGYAVP